jgi:(S)-ureidoglycine aminohydrolase
MKRLALYAAILCCTNIFAQNSPIPSKVFVWENEPTKAGAHPLFNGSALILAKHSIVGIDIVKGKQITFEDKTTEAFFIVKQGPVTVKLNGNFAVLDRGSVISVLPGDKLFINNTGDNTAQLYEMLYVSKSPADVERGIKAGGSFILNWKDVIFKPTEKGGTRQFFDRQTVMLNRFDIHVTQLNEGLKSHDPHTHTNEEIILMLDGNAEMQIGTDHQKANPGDVVFLNSMVLHNLTNVGKTPCLYFAIQWN